MNQEQQAVFIKYITSFVAMLQRKGFSREQARLAMISSNACLLSEIWHIKPIGKESDRIEAFATRIQDEVIAILYGKPEEKGDISE